MHLSRTLARGAAASVASLALVAGGALVSTAEAGPKPCPVKKCDTGWLKKDTGWGKAGTSKKDTGWVVTNLKRDTGW